MPSFSLKKKKKNWDIPTGRQKPLSSPPREKAVSGAAYRRVASCGPQTTAGSAGTSAPELGSAGLPSGSGAVRHEPSCQSPRCWAQGSCPPLCRVCWWRLWRGGWLRGPWRRSPNTGGPKTRAPGQVSRRKHCHGVESQSGPRARRAVRPLRGSSPMPRWAIWGTENEMWLPGRAPSGLPVSETRPGSRRATRPLQETLTVGGGSPPTLL